MEFVDSGIVLPEVDEAAAAWADYDNDNDLDLLIAGTTDNGAVTKLYRNSNNTFVDSGINFTNLDLAALDWADYDRDGDMDFVITGRGPGESHQTLLYKNNGNGTFSEVNTSLPGLLAGSVDWADFDNDGDPDLLLTGRLADLRNFTGVFRNIDGTFEQIETGFLGIRRGQASWVDYDVDGDHDFMITGLIDSNDTPLTAFFNNQDGTFTGKNDLGVKDVKLGSVDWADYDDDGDPDLLLTGRSTSGWVTEVYRNQGTSFVRLAAVNGVEFGNARWGDYDNDGDLDFLVTGRQSDQTRLAAVYTNNDGAFSDIGAGLTGVSKAAVAWGDYDKDGDLDVFVSGQIDDDERVGRLYNNTSTTPYSAPVPPSGLTHEIGPDYLKLSWGQASDAQTGQGGLTYNLRVGTTPQGGDIVSPDAMNDGRRKVVGTGNVSQNRSWIIKPLPPGLYYWSVQAIDHASLAGAFSEEKTFFLSDPILPVALTDFTAQWDGNDILLTWITASETNNAGFELHSQFEAPRNSAPVLAIQESPVPAAAHWQSIAFLPGAGTTNEPQTYTHRIPSAAPGAYFFPPKTNRLRRRIRLLRNHTP